jgi:hypothetical protein
MSAYVKYGRSRSEELSFTKRISMDAAKESLDSWVTELMVATGARWFTLTFRNVRDQLPGKQKVNEAAELAMKLMGTGKSTRLFMVEEEGTKPRNNPKIYKGAGVFQPMVSVQKEQDEGGFCKEYCDDGSGLGRRHLHGIIKAESYQGYKLALQNHQFLYGFYKDQGVVTPAVVTYLVKYMLKNPDSRFWYKGGVVEVEDGVHLQRESI